MKRIIAIALFAASGLVAAGNLSAQDYKLEAKIPFDFTLNHKVLPAGTYTIYSEAPNIVVVRNWQTGIGDMSAVHADNKGSTTPELVFQRYGNQYFLRKIHASNAVNMAIPRSKQEQRMRVQRAALQDSNQTLIALK
jgi:hypothetical protein